MISRSMVTSGHWLFRWRSYLPLVFLPLFLFAVWQGEWVEMQLSDPLGDAIEILAIVMVLTGEAIRIATVGFVPRGTSGRNTDKGQLAERLNTTGLYSLTRNPLYLGNCLMYLGLTLYTQHLWFAAILALALTLYYERIIAAEEDFLIDKFGADYTSWAERTPAFFPRLNGWQRPDMAFSLRTVIRREHMSAFGGIAALYLVELGQSRLPAVSDPMPAGWHWILAVAALMALASSLAKKAGLLKVSGR